MHVVQQLVLQILTRYNKTKYDAIKTMNMKKLADLINIERLSIKELFSIKGGVMLPPPGCDSFNCGERACLNTACQTAACTVNACHLYACTSLTCRSQSSLE